MIVAYIDDERVVFDPETATSMGWTNGLLHITLEDGREFYIFPDSETAGEAAREYWADMAANDPQEFACLVGESTLVAWGLGQYAGPGSTQVQSLTEWLDLHIDVPEEHFGSYNGEESTFTSKHPDFEEFTVAYRHNQKGAHMKKSNDDLQIQREKDFDEVMGKNWVNEPIQKRYWQIERKTSAYNKYMKWRIRFYRDDLSLISSDHTKTRKEAEQKIERAILTGKQGFPIGRRVTFSEYEELKVIIRKGDGSTIDNYTVWIDTAVFGMSKDPFHWQSGFNQYAGDTATDGLFEPMSEGGKKLGKLIDISDAPENVRKAIRERME